MNVAETKPIEAADQALSDALQDRINQSAIAKAAAGAIRALDMTRSDIKAKATEMVTTALTTGDNTQTAAYRAAIGVSAANALIPLLRKMSEGINNVCILECSDSTDYEDNATGGLYAGQKFFRWLCDQFPTYSGKMYKNPGTTWPAAVDYMPSRARTAFYYNAAIPSTNGYWFMGSAFDNIFGLASQPATAPDLIIFNHGKNNDYTQVESVHVAMYMAQMQMLSLRWPNAGMIAFAQIPNPQDTQQDIKARALRIAAGHMGVTVIDTYADFLDYAAAGGILTDLFIDPTNVHQNQVGDDRRFALLKRAATGRLGQFVPVRTSLAERINNTLVNGDLSAGAANVIDNWTLTNCTVTDDAVNYETGGRSRILSNTAAGIGYMQQALTGDAVKRYLGKFAFMAIRLSVPAGAGQTESTIGQSQLSNGVDNYRTWGFVQNADAKSKDGFFWVATAGFVRPSTTQITATVYAANNAGAAAGKQIRVDRVVMGPGVLLRDMN